MTRKPPQEKSKKERDANRPAASFSTRGWVRLACPVLVAIVTFAAFWPVLGAEFVNYDDPKLYVDNTNYRGFDAGHVRWMFTTLHMGHYQPLTWLSAAMDHAISGTQPSSYHRTNLILHTLSAVMLYFVALRLLAAAAAYTVGSHGGSRASPGEDGRKTHGEKPLRAGRHDASADSMLGSWAVQRGLPLAAAVAALLYAIHPLRVESVAWVSERRDVLSLFFLIAALWGYLRATTPGESEVKSWRVYGLSCLLLLCSLLSKAWGMSFVVVVIILDVYPLRRLPASVTGWRLPPFRSVLLQKVPYLLLGLAAAVIAGYAQHSGTVDTMRSLGEWGMLDRFAQASYGLAFYVSKTIWPRGLAALYELPYQMNPFELRFIASYAAVVIGAVLVFLLRRKWPALAAVTIIYVVVVFPVLGMVQAGPQLVADKYSYICCIGWGFLAAGGLLQVWRRGGHYAAVTATAAATGVLLITLFALTYRQAGVWHDSKVLWQHAVEVGQPSARAHLGLGHELWQEKRNSEAVEQFRAAVAIRPDFGHAWYELGNALYREQLLAAGPVDRQQVMEEAKSAYREAMRFMVERYDPLVSLGQIHLEQGRTGEAEAAFREAVAYIEAHPEGGFSPWPSYALGHALFMQGRFAEAREYLTKAHKHEATRAAAEDDLRRLPPSPRASH
jgi:protein O-mannosyl-transferase